MNGGGGVVYVKTKGSVVLSEHEVLLLSDSEQAGLVCCIIVLAMGFLLEIGLELSLRYY
jgi:hypothetical protein